MDVQLGGDPGDVALAAQPGQQRRLEARAGRSGQPDQRREPSAAGWRQCRVGVDRELPSARPRRSAGPREAPRPHEAHTAGGARPAVAGRRRGREGPSAAGARRAAAHGGRVGRGRRVASSAQANPSIGRRSQPRRRSPRSARRRDVGGSTAKRAAAPSRRSAGELEPRRRRARPSTSNRTSCLARAGALAGARRLRARVALDRLGRDLVDVGEDRLGEQGQRPLVGVRSWVRDVFVRSELRSR